MAVKNTLNFHLLSDPANAYEAELGLTSQVPGPANDIDDALPIPARIVVDMSGIVRTADIDADYTNRPEPSKTVADVASLA